MSLTTSWEYWHTWHRRLYLEFSGPSWPCYRSLVHGVECFSVAVVKDPGLPLQMPVRNNEYAALGRLRSFQATAPNITTRGGIFSFLKVCGMQPRSGIYNGNCSCKLMLNSNFNPENWFYRFQNGNKRTRLIGNKKIGTEFIFRTTVNPLLQSAPLFSLLLYTIFKCQNNVKVKSIVKMAHLSLHCYLYIYTGSFSTLQSEMDWVELFAPVSVLNTVIVLPL